MPKKKPGKLRRHRRVKQALADIDKIQKDCKKLELDLKRVENDLKKMPFHPVYGPKCKY
jgi:hypothetical protein